MAEIKFCGLTRVEDARVAAELGAAFAGVIFAGGARLISPELAASVLDGAHGVRRVGVFAHQSPTEIARVARIARLDVVQLHGDPSAGDVKAVRATTGLRIWAVVRIAGTALPDGARALADVADGLLLDARVAGALGGTGRTLDWEALEVPRGRAIHVLAGGLAPDNVARAITALRPSVVDVSSGVEQAPGIKDPALMRRFAEAVRAGATA